MQGNLESVSVSLLLSNVLEKNREMKWKAFLSDKNMSSTDMT